MIMQEEIENKTVNLAISTTKLTARTFVNVGKALLRAAKIPAEAECQETGWSEQGRHERRDRKTAIRGFERYARKYGIDFAITKDKSAIPPRYMIFFKAQDKDALTAAFQEYSASAIKKRSQKPSVLNQLHDLIQQVAELPGKVREKRQEHGDR